MSDPNASHPDLPPVPAAQEPGFAAGAQVPGQYPGSAAFARQATGHVDVNESFTWSWKIFIRYWWQLLLPGILMGVAAVVGAALIVVGILLMLSGSTTRPDGSPAYQFHVGGLILTLLGAFALLFVILLLQGGLLSGILRVGDGEPVSGVAFLKPTRTSAYVATAILMALATAIGLVLLIVPGLIAIFAFQYAPIMVLERKVSPFAAMGASARLSFAKFGDSLIIFLIHWLYGWVGGLIAVIGSIVTLPLGEAFLVHAYRDLVGRPFSRLP